MPSARALWSLMLAMTPVAIAEFDQCARPSGVWAGYDQGFGRSRGYAIAYNGGNVFVAGYAIGNLSFHSMHKDGTYADHEGTSSFHDSHTDVTVHHDSGTFTDPNYYKDPAGTQHGMDSIIYKINAAGVPQSVFAANTENFDGVYDSSSVNGAWSGYSQFNALDGFDAEGDMVAGAGYFRGNLSFPMADGSTTTVANAQQKSNYYGFVCKVNMATNSAVWVTDDGMRDNGVYVRSTATTAAGHVLVSGNIRYPSSHGFLNLYNGATGANVWSMRHSQTSTVSSVDAVGEMAFVSGLFSGAAVDLFRASTSLTSSADGSGSDAFVAALDASSSSSGPVASWVVQIGGSSSYPSVKASGDSLYVAGYLSSASIIGTCTMTGELGGYLVKLNRATGACVWARDTPPNRHAVSDGTHVWTVQTSSKKSLAFDVSHTLDNIGNEDDMFMAKFQSSDGAGLWATVIGGTGDDVADSATITPSGPAFSGSSQSEALSVGDLTVKNLHHQQAEARAGFDPSASHAQNAGQRALFVVMVATTDEIPSCISNCPSGELSDATIDGGHCYAHGVCVADGHFSDAHYPAMSCLRCDSASNQLMFSSVPDTTNHCYFDDICHPGGERAKGKTWRNEPSVCEWCDPAVDTAGYTLKTGYHYDKAVAGTHFGASSFGLIFGDWANGCQILPDVTLPADRKPALATALVNPTSAAATAVGARATSAIRAINSASDTNQGVEEAWAWYHGDTATCPMSDGTCSHTPAEAADAMGAAFETAMTYGQAISRVKVQQGLVLLQEQYDAPDGIVDQHVSDLKMDIVAHMLIPFYQGVIRSALEMDAAGGSAERLAAQRRGDAYWKVIDDAVENKDFDATDRATLSTMFANYPPKVTNYCAATVRLLRNLPSASTLQYAEERPVGSHATGTLVAYEDGEFVHLTPTDVGTAAAGKVCLAELDGWQDEVSYPKTYVNCGVSNTLLQSPNRVVTMTQGATEILLAMGLGHKIVGTAYLDDEIWPRYAAAYANIPVLSDVYPTEAQIMATDPDFIVGSFMSAFREASINETSGSITTGIFTNNAYGNKTIGPCDGPGSDYFESGSNTTVEACELGVAGADPCSTCRPQLRAAGIGTWLDSTACEDSTLRPQGGATEDTVYAAIRQIGEIFNVRSVAEQLVSEIRLDFAIAENTLAHLASPLRAVWLDCVGCCSDEQLFIGAGAGAPSLIMQEAGLTNVFADVDKSWSCQNISTILDADPDVIVVVDAAWDSALEKIDFIHNHSGFCNARFVMRADYITIPFSASTLGPRNGAAALDLASAAIHVTTGNIMMDHESGVSFFDPLLLQNRTAGMRCPINPENVVYARGQDGLNREDVLEAEKASLQAELDAERTQCAVDKNLNAVSVLGKLEKGTIKVVFD